MKTANHPNMPRKRVVVLNELAVDPDLREGTAVIDLAEVAAVVGKTPRCQDDNPRQGRLFNLHQPLLRLGANDYCLAHQNGLGHA
jgi:hypothetical protein